MNSKDLLNEEIEYKSFFTLNELDKRAFELSDKFGFEIKEVGRSERNHPIYLIKTGNGSKNAFVWGFPHPNEPIGSLTIDWLLNYFGKNPDKLNETDYTWYFIYTADPDGTKLNENWFKGELSIEKYFFNFYRPPGSRMIDWTFPIKYKDFEWKTPLKETEVLMSIIKEIKPDLMYPIHNSGFSGAYFFSTKKFDDEYYKSLTKLTEDLGIPLHMGEPEEECMIEIVKPFYFDFGLADYYEQMKKTGSNPVKVIKHGNNSSFYLLDQNPNSITIKGEVPYFLSEKIKDTSLSSKTRREVWIKFLDDSEKNLEIVQPTVDKILNILKEPNPWYYLAFELKRRWNLKNDSMKNYVNSNPDFDKPASEAEIFTGILGSHFYSGGLIFGQVRRAALECGLDESKIKMLEDKIKECSEFINARAKCEVVPIKKLVQLQLGVLFETIEAIKRNK